MKRKTYKFKGIIIVLTMVLFACLWLWPIQATADDTPTNQPELTAQIQQLEQAYNANPNSTKIKKSLASLYNNQAVILAQQKQWTAAENYMRRAIELDDSDPNMQHNLSVVYVQHGIELYAAANPPTYTTEYRSNVKQLAQQAIALDPNNPEAYILLGDTEYMNQEMDAAISAWQKAAQLAPTNQQVQDRLAKITREASIEDKLNQEENPFFIVKIDPSLENIPNFDINAALDHARISVDQDFNFNLNHRVPVIVYTPEEYQATMLGAPVWSEGAFDGKLRIVIMNGGKNIAEIKSIIVHEYLHSVVGDLTQNSCPRWFNEGLAKYMEYKYGVRPLISLLALAYNTNTIVDFNNLNTTIVSTDWNTAMLSYQQAFSFIYFLVEKYGMENVSKLLRLLGNKQDFQSAVNQVYNMPLSTLEQNWRLWLTDFIQRWAEAPAGHGY